STVFTTSAVFVLIVFSSLSPVLERAYSDRIAGRHRQLWLFFLALLSRHSPVERFEHSRALLRHVRSTTRNRLAFAVPLAITGDPPSELFDGPPGQSLIHLVRQFQELFPPLEPLLICPLQPVLLPVDIGSTYSVNQLG